jgi:hypothetical protein
MLGGTWNSTGRFRRSERRFGKLWLLTRRRGKQRRKCVTVCQNCESWQARRVQGPIWNHSAWRKHRPKNWNQQNRRRPCVSTLSATNWRTFIVKCQLGVHGPGVVPLRTDTVAYNRPRLTITRREPVGACAAEGTSLRCFLKNSCSVPRTHDILQEPSTEERRYVCYAIRIQSAQ